MYRVLIVVPNVAAKKLAIQHEIHWISRNFRTEICASHTCSSGMVAVSDFLQFITSRKFDIIHFIADGDEDGIEMDNDTVLDMDEIAQVARQTDAVLIYLNSCRSARLAQYLIDQGVPAVIASTMALTDHNAWSTASYFYNALLQWKDFYRSYEEAKPGDGSLSFYSNGKIVHRSVRPIMEKMDQVNESILELSERVDRNRVERDTQIGNVASAQKEQGKEIDIIRRDIRWLIIIMVIFGVVLLIHSFLIINAINPQNPNLGITLDLIARNRSINPIPYL